MITLPAGTYYIGDPCYVFERPSWEKLGTQTDWFIDPVGTLNGRQLVAFGTAYGDGVYADQDGNDYPVDSGLIGAIPVELIEKGTVVVQSIKCNFGKIMTFTRPFRCYIAESYPGQDRLGKLHFGAIVIDTDPRNTEN